MFKKQPIKFETEEDMRAYRARTKLVLILMLAIPAALLVFAFSRATGS